MVPDGTTGLDLLLAAAADVHCQKLHLSFGITDPSYWSKVKNRSKPAPRIDELLNAPEAVQRAMVGRWARMLKMQVSTEDRRRAALLEVLEVTARAMREIA